MTAPRKPRPSRAKPGAVRGRPWPAGVEARTVTLAVRVTPSERDGIAHAAEAAGVTVATWCRRALVGAAGG